MSPWESCLGLQSVKTKPTRRLSPRARHQTRGSTCLVWFLKAQKPRGPWLKTRPSLSPRRPWSGPRDGSLSSSAGLVSASRLTLCPECPGSLNFLIPHVVLAWLGSGRSERAQGRRLSRSKQAREGRNGRGDAPVSLKINTASAVLAFDAGLLTQSQSLADASLISLIHLADAYSLAFALQL